MSRVIDERIVSMKFDNRGFADGVKSTMGLLDKLKSALNFKGAAAGVSEAQAAVNKFNGAPMLSSVQNITSEFSILGMTAANVLGNQISRALDVVRSKMGEFTTKPIRDGLAEYELNMDSIQTILANTSVHGTKLEDVKKTLAELNEYADLTVYSFAEMTKNIGTFTAAGVELEPAKTAIKGISNLAAMSGSNSQQAATAMYQMSQALASGKVGLMDWNSLVNAGMGGSITQDALKMTSRALGTGVDAAIAKQGSFRDSLSEGWLTKDVLEKTFRNFSGEVDAETLISEGFTKEDVAKIQEQSKLALEAATVSKTFSATMDVVKESLGSGWATTWQYIIGDFEQAKKLWTAVSNELADIINKTSDARNKIVGEWSEKGGRDAALQAMATFYKEAKENIVAAAEGFKEFAPAIDAKKLIEYTQKIKEFIENFAKAGDSVKAFKSFGGGLGKIFQGAFNVIKELLGIGKEFFSAFNEGFSELSDKEKNLTPFQRVLYSIGEALKYLGSRANDFASFLSRFSKMVSLFDTAKQMGRAAASTIKVIFTILDIGLGVISRLLGRMDGGKGFVNIIRGFFDILRGGSEALTRFNEGLLAAGGPLEDIRNKFFRAANGIKESFSDNVFGSILLTILGFIGDIGKAIASFNIIEFLKTVGSFFSLAGQHIVHMGEMIKNALFGVAGPAVFSFGGLLEGLGQLFKTLVDSVVYAMKEIGGALADGFNSENFDKILSLVDTLFLGGLLLLFKNFLGGTLPDQIKEALVGDHDSIWAAIKDAILPEEKMEDVGEKAKSMLEPVTDTLESMQNTLKAMTLMQIAAAVGVLTGSIILLADIDGAKLTKSLTAITGMFLQLAGMLYLIQAMNITKAGISLPIIGAGLISISVAVVILAGAVKALSDLEWEEIAKGLTGLAGILVMLTGTVKYMQGNAAGFFIISAALISLGVAVNLLGFAVKQLSKLEWEEVAKGLTGLAGILTAVALFQKFTAANKAGLAAGVGIAILAVGISGLAIALRLMSSMDLEGMARSLALLGGSLFIIMQTMSMSPKGLIASSLGLIAIAGALTTLAVALKIMGSMSIGDTIQTLVLLAGTLGILAAGVNMMSTALPGAAAMVIVTAALSLLVPVIVTLGSLPWTVVALGLGAIALAFGILAAAGYLLTPVVPTILALALSIGVLGVSVAAIVISITLFVAAISLLLTGLAALAAVGTEALTNLIGLIPALAKAVGDALVALLVAIADSGKALMEAIATILISIFDAVTAAAPALFEMLKTVLLGIIQLLRDLLPGLLGLIDELLKGLLQLIIDNIPLIKDALVVLVTAMCDVLIATSPSVAAAGTQVVTDLINAIVAMVPFLVESGFKIVMGFLQGIQANLPGVIQKGADIIIEFVGGIAGQTYRISAAAADAIITFINGLAQAIRDKGPALRQAGWNLAGAIIDGITGGLAGQAWRAVQKAGEVAGSIISAIGSRLKINSPSKVMLAMMDSVGEGITMGLDRQTTDVEKSSGKLGDAIINSMQDIVHGKDFNINPTIKPVVDISDVKKSSLAINKMFKDQPVPVDDIYQQVDAIMSEEKRNITPFVTGQNVTNINFTQNNTSPKALSEIDIYRQTSNQISMIKEVVNNAR